MLRLTTSERTELQHQAEALTSHADSARHARLILLLAEGMTWAEIRTRLHCSDSYIARWSKRFAAERLAGLYSRHTGRERYKVTDDVESRVLKWTLKRRPADGSRHWSSRKLAAALGGAISHTTVARIWAKHGISPHRFKAYPAPDNESADTGVVDVIGMYLGRSQHAMVFRLNDTDPDIEPPLATQTDRARPAAARQRHMQHREGIHALYTALKNSSDTVSGVPSTTRHTAAEFAAFLASVAADQPTDRQMRVIADNPAARKTPALNTVLTDHPNLHVHFTTSYASWLSHLEQSLLQTSEPNAGGEETPAPRPEQKLVRYLRRVSQRSRFMKWKQVQPHPSGVRERGKLRQRKDRQ